MSIVCMCQYQHERLCYFGHWAHFILTIYWYKSSLFFINVISVNTVEVIIIVICKVIIIVIIKKIKKNWIKNFNYRMTDILW